MDSNVACLGVHRSCTSESDFRRRPLPAAAPRQGDKHKAQPDHIFFLVVGSHNGATRGYLQRAGRPEKAMLWCVGS